MMESKTNWKLDDLVMPEDMNRIEENVSEVNIGLSAVTDRGYLQSKVITDGSVNTITQSGKYAVDGTRVSDCPTNTLWFFIDVTTTNSDYAAQIATAWSDAKTYRRQKMGDIWTPWQEIATMDKVDDLVVERAIALYVNVNAGSDTVGDGTESKPFKTIMKALRTLPLGAINRNDRNTWIFLAEGIYDEMIWAYNRYDIIEFVLQGDVTIESIYLKNANVVFKTDNMEKLRTLNIKPKNSNRAVNLDNNATLQFGINIKAVCDGAQTTATYFVGAGVGCLITSTWSPIPESGIYINNIKQNVAGLFASFGKIQSFPPVRGNNNAGTLINTHAGIIQMPALEATTTGTRVFKGYGGLAIGGAGVDLT